jgi:hypothetical protein
MALFVISLLTGCQAKTNIDILVSDTGDGVIDVQMVLDDQAAAYLPNGEADLRLDDLEDAGWSIQGPDTDNGETTISARHGFANSQQAQQLLDQLVANDGVFQDFRIDQSRSLTNVETSVSGSVDLSEGLESLGDPAVAEATGNPLGFDPAELQRNLEVNPQDALALTIRVQAPGDQQVTELAYGEVNNISLETSAFNQRPVTYFLLAAFLLLAAIVVGKIWKVYKPAHKRSILDTATRKPMPKVEDGGRHFR